MNGIEDPPAYSIHQHACLTLNMSDRLRLIRFPVTIIGVIRQSILNNWERGIQKEREYVESYEFKLSGNPWHGQGSEAVESRVLMTSILTALYTRGWYLLASTDVSKKEHDKDSLVFQLGTVPPSTSFFAVSFDSWDKLRLIGAPSNVIRAVLVALGKQRIQKEEWVYSQSAYQIKLHGYPWAANGDEAVTSRVMILTLLDCLASLHWKLYGSVDMSIGVGGCDTDTWFFYQTNS